MRPYPALCLAAAAAMLAAAFVFPAAPIEAAAACFVAALGFVLPMAGSNRRLGLMDGDGSLVAEGRRRMDLLSASCRWHPGAYLVCLAGTAALCGTLILFPGVGHPGLAGAAGVAALGGCWFGLVEPVAERLHANGWRAPHGEDAAEGEAGAAGVRAAPAWATRAYGVVALVCGVGWAVLAVAPGRLPPVPHGVALVLTMALMLPFVVAFTNLGLNSDGPRPASVQRRWERLAAASPWWPGIWWFGLAVAVGPLLVWRLGPAPGIDPFFAFFAGISLVAGLWFLLVHPVAVRLMTEEREQG